MDTYEKKYKEAQGWIEKIYPTLQHEQQMEAEAFFPELKESEDERIRKAIHIYLDWLDGRKDYAPKGDYTIKDIIAWLEKQGEQKPNYTTLVETGNDGINTLVTREVSANDYEEKPVGKVEPKFKVGDIIINIHYKWDGKHRIREITDGKYIFDSGSYINIKEQDSWELADKVEPFDKYEGLTDFERTLADICIGWIGEELGWKQYIKDNADVLLKIAVEKFNSVQDVPFEQKSAWSEEDEQIILSIEQVMNCASLLNIVPEKMDKIRTWLKSLKQRIGG